jgi:hypothetical protein
VQGSEGHKAPSTHCFTADSAKSLQVAASSATMQVHVRLARTVVRMLYCNVVPTCRTCTDVHERMAAQWHVMIYLAVHTVFFCATKHDDFTCQGGKCSANAADVCSAAALQAVLAATYARVPEAAQACEAASSEAGPPTKEAAEGVLPS